MFIESQAWKMRLTINVDKFACTSRIFNSFINIDNVLAILMYNDNVFQSVCASSPKSRKVDNNLGPWRDK